MPQLKRVFHHPSNSNRKVPVENSNITINSLNETELETFADMPTFLFTINLFKKIPSKITVLHVTSINVQKYVC